MFFLLYRHTDDNVFDDFSKISDHFLKISEDSPKLVQRSHQRFRTVSEVCQRWPKPFDEDLKMFRSYVNKFKYNLRDKLDISEVNDIFTSEDMENVPLVSRMWFHEFYEWCILHSQTH